MTMNISAQNKRDAELLQALLNMIKDNGNDMHYSEIKKEFPSYFQLNEKEIEPTATREHAWHAVVQMIGGIECKVAGLVEIEKAYWSVTPKGEALINVPAEQFYQAYHTPWLEYNKKKKERAGIVNKDIPEINELENTAAIDISTIQTNALEAIEQHILAMTPSYFEKFVGALLRGMGYYVNYIAKGGKDGGLDITAYHDPLGANGSHIKVQVKHYTSSNVGAKEVRELIAKLSKPNDVGIFVTSGDFSKDCKFEMRDHHKSLRLIGMKELIELWIQYYPNLSDSDKACLPLIPVYHLNTKKL